jgi:hypothetical protein
MPVDPQQYPCPNNGEHDEEPNLPRDAGYVVVEREDPSQNVEHHDKGTSPKQHCRPASLLVGASGVLPAWRAVTEAEVPRDIASKVAQPNQHALLPCHS